MERLIRRQREAWARRWAEMGIRVDGDPELQRAINFSLFHLDASIARPVGGAARSARSHRAQLPGARLLGLGVLRPAVLRRDATGGSPRDAHAIAPGGSSQRARPPREAGLPRRVVPVGVRGRRSRRHPDVGPRRRRGPDPRLDGRARAARRRGHRLGGRALRRLERRRGTSPRTTGCASSSRARASGPRGSSATPTAARTSAASSAPTSTTSSSTTTRSRT